MAKCEILALTHVNKENITRLFLIQASNVGQSFIFSMPSSNAVKGKIFQLLPCMTQISKATGLHGNMENSGDQGDQGVLQIQNPSKTKSYSFFLHNFQIIGPK